MKIWRLTTDANNYDYLVIPNEKDAEKIVNEYQFNGTRIADRWIPIEVQICL